MKKIKIIEKRSYLILIQFISECYNIFEQRYYAILTTKNIYHYFVLKSLHLLLDLERKFNNSLTSVRSVLIKPRRKNTRLETIVSSIFDDGNNRESNKNEILMLVKMEYLHSCQCPRRGSNPRRA